jgi:SAM-dependent methyltransferase
MDPSAYREMADTEKRHWWFVGRRRIIGDVVAGLGLPAHADILEIGAGTGGNLPWLSKFGTVTAVEMDPFARRHAFETTGIEVLDGALPDNVPFEGRKFDLICMFDVLEHVEFEAASLDVVARHLKPGGRFVVTVPAYSWMWSEHDKMLHHFRRYTRGTLRTALEGSGMRVEKLTHFNAALLPVAMAARAVAKLTKKGSPGTGMPSSGLNSILAGILSSESPVVSKKGLPFGLSVMAIATAPGAA